MRHVSPAEWFAARSAEWQARELARLSPEARAALLFQWETWWARPNQVAPPGMWAVWLILAGRGFGKTRAGAEWVRARWKAGASRIAIVAETAADARDVLVEGQSGLLAISPKDERPIYESSKRRLTWPNGAIATLYNGTEPDQLRGPEHDSAWVDELAKYRHAQETWDMLQLGLRLGTDPRACVTTTPRPIPLVRDLMADPSTVVTRGATFDNRSNLPKRFIDRIRKRYEGTRLGRQELFAEVLDDIPNALWTRAMIGPWTRGEWPADHEAVLALFRRVIVAVDPSGAGSAGDEAADEIGIVVVGETFSGHFHVLEDATCKLSPAGWGRRAAARYRHWKADALVAERNFGGAMVEAVIRTADPGVNVKMVTASRGKAVRAEPIAALYEQGRVTHARDLVELEDQMLHMTLIGFVGDGSPDRLDALVWALTELSEPAASVSDSELFL